MTLIDVSVLRIVENTTGPSEPSHFGRLVKPISISQEEEITS